MIPLRPGGSTSSNDTPQNFSPAARWTGGSDLGERNFISDLTPADRNIPPTRKPVSFGSIFLDRSNYTPRQVKFTSSMSTTQWRQECKNEEYAIHVATRIQRLAHLRSVAIYTSVMKEPTLCGQGRSTSARLRIKKLPKTRTP